MGSGRAGNVFSRGENELKGKHPELTTSSVRCTNCGNEFLTRSSLGELVIDVCSNCHPAYTGVERAVVQGSRVERFERRRALAVGKIRT